MKLFTHSIRLLSIIPYIKAYSPLTYQKCVAINPTITDEWCQLDCMCASCPGCDQGYCQGYCGYEESDLTTETSVDPTEEGHCKAVDPRVDDQWCEDDCMCSFCPGCGVDYCQGYCEWVEPPTTTTIATTTTSTKKTTTEEFPINQLCDSPFYRNAIYIDYKIHWGDLEKDIKNAVNNCFNTIILGWYIGHGNYAIDAAAVWRDMRQRKREEILEYVHSKNAVLLLGVGGPDDWGRIESMVAEGNGYKYADKACHFAGDYMLDGVDFDLELAPGDNGPFLDGSMEQFIIDVSSTCRQILGSRTTRVLISHSPPAKYFSDWAGPNFGYSHVFKNFPNLIDWVNIKYYNEGSLHYNSYHDLFEADKYQVHEAVFEVNKNGVPLNKIVVGKPIGATGYANNGFVEPKDLNEWGCLALKENGWRGGFLGWRYDKTEGEVYEKWGEEITNQCD